MDIVEEAGVGLPSNATHPLLHDTAGHHGNTAMNQCDLVMLYQRLMMHRGNDDVRGNDDAP